MTKRKADCTPEEWQALRAVSRERNRLWRIENPERTRQQRLRYRAKYEEKRKLENAAWKARNPEKVAAYNRWHGIVRRCRDDRKAAKRLFSAIRELVPLCADRADIVGEAVLIFLEGKARTVEAAARLGWKAYWQKFSKFGVPISLDAPLPGGQSLHELIPAAMGEAA